MSYMLPHLHNGWQVDQAILSEEDRVVVCFKIYLNITSLLHKIPENYYYLGFG